MYARLAILVPTLILGLASVLLVNTPLSREANSNGPVERRRAGGYGAPVTG